MQTLWFGLLGLLFTGYFVLAGSDYGVGLLLRIVAGKEAERRLVLNAVGPFFLGNEVWLVAAVGVLFGAFPLLEGELMVGTYPVLVATLLGVLAVTAGFQLRGRTASTRRKGGWDVLILVGALLAATGWGVVLGNLLLGLPLDSRGKVVDGWSSLLHPNALLFGALTLTLSLLQGATFLAMRLEGSLARRSGRCARILVLPAVALVLTVVASGVLSPSVWAAVSQPWVALTGAAVVVLAVLGAGWLLSGNRTGLAFAATSTAAGLPVLVVGGALFPNALVSTVDGTVLLTVTKAAAAPETLELLSWFAIPLLPAILGVQWMSWWVFRGRVGDRAQVYF